MGIFFLSKSFHSSKQRREISPLNTHTNAHTLYMREESPYNVVNMQPKRSVPNKNRRIPAREVTFSRVMRGFDRSMPLGPLRNEDQKGLCPSTTTPCGTRPAAASGPANPEDLALRADLLTHSPFCSYSSVFGRQNSRT